MSKNFKDFVKKEKLKLIGRFIILALPLVLGLLLIIYVGLGRISLKFFDNISDNFYKINSVLLIFIGVSHLIILINLFQYHFSILNNATNYKGEDSKIKTANGAASIVNIINIVFIFLYFAYIIVCCLVKNNSTLFNYRNIIRIYQFLSISIFLLLMVIDILIRNSQKTILEEKKKEKSKLEGIIPRNQAVLDSIEYDISDNRNNSNFSIHSLYFINIPTLCIVAFSSVCQFLIKGMQIFHNYLDKELFIEVPLLDSSIYRLFLDGLNTGVIVSTILMSRIIFMVIKNYWHYNYFQIHDN